MKSLKPMLICIILTFSLNKITADEIPLKSKIISVKLYQNQATITRKSTIFLKKGINSIILSSLPNLLYDWSVKGSLPKDFHGRIVSMEVIQKALIKKRQENILKIENKLENLREKDQILVDELTDIKSQEKFLNSILDFTNQTVSKELATRIPQIQVWDNTLNYVTKKKKDILQQKRRIEKEREKIGKEIQKWEFELSQIAGYNYFKNYNTLNKVILQNRSEAKIQQFAEITEQYAERTKLLKHPTDKVDIEKRLIVNIFSESEKEANFIFSYVIPNTYWQMKYDIRAHNENKNINIAIYADIYQKTGEDWKNIKLSLSTGSPVNSISPPQVEPWFLDLYHIADTFDEDKNMMKKDESYKGGLGGKARIKNKKQSFETEIKERGPYFEINLPLKPSIISSDKYQKKFIKDYTISNAKDIKFYYELIPASVRNGFLKVQTTNITELPWLSGEAQIFLENEFMGKVNIPFTPPGKYENFILGIETRITASKELIKKYEDTSGVFGGNRRILYKYKIIAENQLPQEKEIIILDAIPVSRNKKIQVSIENLSIPFLEDLEFEKSTDYSRGIRKWKLKVAPHSKMEITYDVVISFDKEINIQGIR